MASARDADHSKPPGRRLSIHLLGGFQVRVEDEPAITFESDLVRGLLAFLAVERERPHRREALAALFWPELPDSIASHRFRQAISNLRHVLHDVDCPTPFLLVTRTDIQLNPETDVRLDVSEFTALLAACQAHRHRQRAGCTACRDRLDQAVALYRGPFLAGLSPAGSAGFQDWAAAFGEQLHQQILEALITLASVLERWGAYSEACSYARRAARWEPWNETVQRQVMRVLALQGQRTAALRQFQLCRQALVRELGVKPDLETIALYHRIRADQPFLPESPSLPRHNLPATLSSFVGRKAETTALEDLLATERLVTLTGVGGGGKTRLALHVAEGLVRSFDDGVWLVELATLADPRLVPAAVAGVLGLREQPQRPLEDTLRDYLRPREALLIFDNCEHLIDTCSDLAASLLRACPLLTIMATSRQPLRVSGEVQWPVPPLATPEPVRELLGEVDLLVRLLRYDAVALFVKRAQAVEPSFSLSGENAWAVAGICRRLDGLPLAIELAAARLRVLPPQAMLDRMGQALPLLTGGARDLPARHRTLRNTIAWSYELLGPDEQALFRRLAVFRGCTMEAVGTVCSAPATQPGSASIAVTSLQIDVLAGIDSLVEKSLVRQEAMPNGQPWYDLQETVREFAQERLTESGEGDVIQRRHVLFYLRLGETAERDVAGPQEAVWQTRIEQEHDNFRAALDSCVAQGYAEPGFRLALALWWFWMIRGHLSEGRQRLTALFARFPHRERTSRWAGDRARALRAAATLASIQGDFAAARALQEDGLNISRTLGDAPGVCSGLEGLVVIASMQGDQLAAVNLAQECLEIARAIGDKEMIGHALNASANVLHERGDYDAARGIAEESVAVLREAGNPPQIAAAYLTLAAVHQDQGDQDAAQKNTEAALFFSRQHGIRRFTALAIANLGNIAAARGDSAVARERLGESMAIQQELADTAGIAFVLERFAIVALEQLQHTRAIRLAGAAATLRATVGSPLPPRSQAKLDDKLSPSRRALGAVASASAWADGRALTLTQAVALSSLPVDDHDLEALVRQTPPV